MRIVIRLDLNRMGEIVIIYECFDIEESVNSEIAYKSKFLLFEEKCSVQRQRASDYYLI